MNHIFESRVTLGYNSFSDHPKDIYFGRFERIYKDIRLPYHRDLFVHYISSTTTIPNLARGVSQVISSFHHVRMSKWERFASNGTNSDKNLIKNNITDCV